MKDLDPAGQELREVDGTTGGSNRGLMIVGALAVVALAVGAVGIFMASKASGQLADIRTAVDEAAAQSAKAAELTTRVAQMDERLTAAGRDFQRLIQAGDQKVADSVQRALDQFSQAMAENRQQINALTERIGTGGSSRAAAPAAASTSSGAGGSAGSSSSGSSTAGAGGSSGAANPDSYTIQAGDTFQKLAPQFGVTVQDILDANPGLDPRRLKIGQTIKVPRRP